MAGRREKPASYSGFVGKNNVSAAERLEDTELREALNVDLDKDNRATRRDGYSQVLSGTDVHSLWSNGSLCLFADGTELKRLNTDETTDTLFTGLRYGNALAYVDTGTAVYLSDSHTVKAVEAGAVRPAGIATPQPSSLSSGAGSLPEGTYLVCTTYTDAQGRESGASEYMSISTSGGVTVTAPAGAPTEAVTWNVYCTTDNGDTFHLARSVAVGASSVTLMSQPSGPVLRTQHVEPPPAGSMMAYLGGRLYVAVGNVLYYSEPYAPEWFRTAYSFKPFPAEITLLAATEDGLFVSADRTYYLLGLDPEQQELQIKSDAKAVPGTLAAVPWDDITTGGEDALINGDALFWLSDRGVMLGGAGGWLRNVTRNRLRIPNSDKGAGVIRHHNGMAQYIGLTKSDGQSPDGMFVGDVAAAEVIRNGVKV